MPLRPQDRHQPVRTQSKTLTVDRVCVECRPVYIATVVSATYGVSMFTLRQGVSLTTTLVVRWRHSTRTPLDAQLFPHAMPQVHMHNGTGRAHARLERADAAGTGESTHYGSEEVAHQVQTSDSVCLYWCSFCTAGHTRLVGRYFLTRIYFPSALFTDCVPRHNWCTNVQRPLDERYLPTRSYFSIEQRSF